MNFSIDRDVLLEHLNLIGRGLPVKTAMPVLNGIKLELTEQDLFLTSSNSDISIQVIINHHSLEITEPGTIVVPGKFLIEIIRKINSNKITINLIEEKIMIIKADRSEFKLNLFNKLDYPPIDFISLDKPLLLDSKELNQIIKETYFAASQTEKRPILTGVSFQYTNQVLRCVATDSYRLSQKIVDLRQEYEDFSFVIPSKSLDELQKILNGLNETIEIYFNKTKVLFKFKNILFQSRLLDGNYPDTSRLIPESFPIAVTFNKDELINSIEKVSLLSPKDKDNNYNVVKFQIHAEHIIEISSSNTEIGFAKDELIPVEPIVGNELRIAFSSKYILEALRSFISQTLTLNFTGEIKPFIIKGDNDPDLIHLILPIRVEW